MATCRSCGRVIEGLATLDCTACGAPVLSSPVTGFPGFTMPAEAKYPFDTSSEQRILTQSALDLVAKTTGPRRSSCATVRHEILQRFELPPGLRPFSVVVRGDELLVLALGDGTMSVERFTMSGVRMQSAGARALGEYVDGMGEPVSLAIGPSGERFVLDAAGCCVHRLDSTGTLVGRYGSPGSAPGELRHPRDIEVSAAGLLLADTQNNRVQSWDFDGRPVRVLGAPFDEDLDESPPAGSGPGEFDAPAGVTVDAEGRLYVADTNNHRVQVFDGDGGFRFQFGEEGDGPGMLLFPTDVRVLRSGAIFTLDLHGRRVQKFDAAGTLAWSLVFGDGAHGDFGNPVGGMDVGQDESVFLPVPAERVVLRCRVVEKRGESGDGE